MALTSIAPPSRPTPSFTCFSLLPLELRRRVWTLCIPSPRIISIAYVGRASCTNYRLSSPPPVLLYINQESRSFALERYKRCFLQGWHVISHTQPYITTECSWHDQHYVWVDLKRDILFYENDFDRISSSQWFTVRMKRPGGGYNRGIQWDIFPRSYGILPPWMVQSESNSRLDSNVAHGEKGNDDNSTSALQQVARIAIPFDEIHVDEIYAGPNTYTCGTGHLISTNQHRRNLIRFIGALEKYFSSLCDVVIVVDMERENAKRKESDEKRKKRDKAWEDYEEENKRGKGISKRITDELFGGGYGRFLDDSKYCLPTGCTSGENVTLIDFNSSERYNSERYQKMEEEIRDWFRNVGERDDKPWSASAVKLMEMRPKQESERDFTWLPATK